MTGRHLARRGALALTLFVLAASASCGQSAPVDTSLLTREPCEPPCWQGLIPGVSTEEEANQFVTTSDLVDRLTVLRDPVTRGGELTGVSIQWLSTKNAQGPDARNSFLVEDGVLQDMIVYLDSHVTLQELFNTYDPPQKFRVVLGGTHSTEARVQLLYPQHGFIAFVEVPMGNTRRETSIQADTTVTWVWYLRAASSLDRFVELARQAGIYSGDVGVESFRDWSGFGPIQVE